MHTEISRYPTILCIPRKIPELPACQLTLEQMERQEKKKERKELKPSQPSSPHHPTSGPAPPTALNRTAFLRTVSAGTSFPPTDAARGTGVEVGGTGKQAAEMGESGRGIPCPFLGF